MLFKFLHSPDFSLVIGEDLLSSGFEDEMAMNRELVKAERTAIAIVKSKIRERLDVAKAFPVLLNWDQDETYAAEVTTYNRGQFYLALRENTDKEPCDNEADWELEDPRDPILVLHTAAITVYLATKQVNGMKVPKDVRELYSLAMQWLDDIENWDTDSDLPQNEDLSTDIISGEGVDLEKYMY